MSDSDRLPPHANLRQLRNQAKNLCRACRAGDPNALRRIGQSHPNYSGLTPAEIAAAGIKLADAQLVIARELGFDSWPRLKRHIESRSQPTTNMHELAAAGDLDALRGAVAREPELVDQPDESGRPPLYTAARYRNQQAIEFLLEHGAAVDIFACAYLGLAADAELLLERNPALARAADQSGMTALHYAALAGRLEIVESLLRSHADVNARDQRGETALMAACHAGPWKSEPAEGIIQLLLDHHAEIDLFQAAAIGRTDLIEAVLDRNIGLIDLPDKRGKTALYHAAHNNRLPAVKLLVERGADINRCDPVGIAALHRTSQESSDELIRYLIDQGADAHLCCYVACGDEAGTRRLLARNPGAADEIFYEFNAVGYAIHCWQLGPLRILLQHGSRLSPEDQQHILRISKNDRRLLDDLLAIQNP